MLTSAQVIPFLLHEEGFVRRHAASYLTEAHDPSPATAGDIWRGIEQFGMWGPTRFVADLQKLPLTEASLWKTMGALSGTLKERSREYLEKAVMAVGMPLLEEHREAILGGLQLSEEAKAHLRRRLELKGRDGVEMWGELMKLAEGIKDFEDLEHDDAKRLVEAIGRTANEEVIAAALAMLHDREINDWRQVYAVDVLGEVRHEQSTDLILEQLRADDDAMPEQAAKALTRMGTAEVVRKIEAFLPGEQWHVRLFGIDVLGKINRPESQEALLRMLEKEEDRELATLIGESLCRLCAPPEVLRVLRDRTAAGRLGGDIGEDIEEEILAAGRMVGYEPPERKKWEERARKQDAEMDRIREEIEEKIANDMAAERTNLPAWDDEVTMPIQAEEKVGRNEPCPCGSGKKYKKCCGKN